MAVLCSLGCQLKTNKEINELFLGWEGIKGSGAFSLVGRPHGKRERPKRRWEDKLRRIIKKEEGGSGLDGSGSG